jgi:hypothetical protein
MFMRRPADGSFLIGLRVSPDGAASMGTFSLVHVFAEGVVDDAFGELKWGWGSGVGVDPVASITAGAMLGNGDIIGAGDITTKRSKNTDTIALYLKKSAGN